VTDHEAPYTATRDDGGLRVSYVTLRDGRLAMWMRVATPGHIALACYMPNGACVIHDAAVCQRVRGDRGPEDG